MKRWYPKAAAVLLAAATGWFEIGPALAYGGDTHQQLMFLAARHYNECVKETPERRLSALQVRYAAKAAVKQAEASFVRRMFRWGFYERNEQSPKSTLWVVETRMHEHFNELTTQLAVAKTDAEKFSVAGRIAAYVQDVTSPVRVVPIYTARFWRFNTNDRFDNYLLADDALISSPEGVCDSILQSSPNAFSDILRDTADRSLQAIAQPIPGMPATWQAFWRLASNPSAFGEYGTAGNRFGNSTSFKCGDERCVLLNDDPLYAEFAAARHLDALVGTIQVLHLLQKQRLPLLPEVAGSSEDAFEKGQFGSAAAKERAAKEKAAKERAAKESAAKESAAKSNAADKAMARVQARNITANE